MMKSFALVCCAVIAMSLIACAQRPPQGIPPSRWPLREFTLIRGAVMCVDCSLEMARSQFPDSDSLYEFRSTSGPIVFRVDWVNDAVRWQQVTFGNRLSVRASDDTLQRLTAPKHLGLPLELNTILRDERTLDIGSVTVLG